jgi:beta-N-acetylhexosaminidase
MELIKSTFSGTADQTKQDDEVSKQAAGKALRQGTEAEEHRDTKQVNAATTGHDEQPDPGIIGSLEEDDDTPRRVPVVKAEKTRLFPLKPPVTPRKNIIPSRRASVERDKIAAPPPRETRAEEAQQSTPVNELPPPTPEAPTGEQDAEPGVDSQPLFEVSPSAGNVETHLPTPNKLAASNEIIPTSQPAPDLPGVSSELSSSGQPGEISPLATLSATYHDTSAAEAAWQTLDPVDEISQQDTRVLASAPRARTDNERPEDRLSTREIERRAITAAIETKKMATPITPLPPSAKREIPTTPSPELAPVKPLETQKPALTRTRALLLFLLLAIILVNASAAGFNQFFGPQGWGSVWSAPGSSGPNLLTQIAQQLQHSPTPGHSKGTPTPPTPTQIVNLLMSHMTLDEKLGQMMMVQFMGQSYSSDLDTMISQYHVGAVLYFQFNIGSKAQLTGLNAEIQHSANLPLLVAVDQEGGTVDRLVNLDGPQPSASQIGASNNPELAYQQGIKDAQNLASYGFNLNLAPVVDVNNVYNPQLYDRTYGNNPTIVSQMAEKYLEGLQRSGKVLGTLKHFPGLGDVSTDPHYGLPALTRDLNSLNSIDWAPYTTLIKQGHVYSIMVTHEIVDALDKSEPSSLSPQVIGILRNQMHFQGVIITDSLTMDSIHNFYTYGQAAAKAVEAGDDILMGADSPATLAQMITGIKQAMSSGAITRQHIDDSVRRILLFKYEMGLLHI